MDPPSLYKLKKITIALVYESMASLYYPYLNYSFPNSLNL